MKRYHVPEMPEDLGGQDYGGRTPEFNAMDLVKHVFFFVFFSVIMSVRLIVSAIDNVGQAGGTLGQYLGAIVGAVVQGVGAAFGSAWLVISSPNAYIASNSYGSIIFAVICIVVLVAIIYQPVSIVMDLIDINKGEMSGTLIRLGISIVLVLILSGIFYYTIGAETITTKLSPNGVSPTSPAVNNTPAITNGAPTAQPTNIINLL